MKRYLIPLAIVAGALVVWRLMRQIDRAKEQRRDVVGEVLGSSGIREGEMDVVLGQVTLPNTAEVLQSLNS